MTELDYSRDAVPHRRGQRQSPGQPIEDAFIRTTLLPQLWRLKDDERLAFDTRVLDEFDPTATGPMRHVVALVLRRLSIDELVRLSSELPEAS